MSLTPHIASIDMTRRYYIYILIFLTAGCAAPSSYDRDYVSRGIQERSDYGLGAAAEPGELNLPEGVSLDDGLTPDEAAAIALWNNAQFQADMAGLGFARADLIEAGMLANPVFFPVFPGRPKIAGDQAKLAHRGPLAAAPPPGRGRV